jgi:hypothetical protein
MKRIWLVVWLAALANCAQSGPPATDSRSAQGGASPPLAALAVAISDGVGDVVALSGRGERSVVVFEEAHGSVLGQLELSVMLLRLRQHQVHWIGLEGAPRGRALALPKSWSGSANGDGFEVGLQLLGDGEIGAAELALLTASGTVVMGLEEPALYAVKPARRGLPEAALLLAIASSTLPPDEAATLAKQTGDETSLTKRLIETDPWVAERWQKMQLRDQTVEQVLRRLEEIQDKALANAVDIDASLRQDFEQDLRFFGAAVQRSAVMVKSLLDNMPHSAAMIIGAAHGRGVREALQKAGVAVAEIRPKSFASGIAELPDRAFLRKLDGNWAAFRPGSFGAALCKCVAKKPPPLLGSVSGDAFLHISTFLNRAARAHRDGQDLSKISLNAGPGRTRLSSLETVGQDVLAHFEVEDASGAMQSVWARAHAASRITGTEGQQPEQRLLAAIDKLQRGGSPGGDSEVSVSFFSAERDARSNTLRTAPPCQ